MGGGQSMTQRRNYKKIIEVKKFRPFYLTFLIVNLKSQLRPIGNKGTQMKLFNFTVMRLLLFLKRLFFLSVS